MMSRMTYGNCRKVYEPASFHRKISLIFCCLDSWSDRLIYEPQMVGRVLTRPGGTSHGQALFQPHVFITVGVALASPLAVVENTYIESHGEL